MFQDVKYDYTANLAGTGDRSEYDNESYSKVVEGFKKDTDVEAIRACIYQHH